MNPRKHNMSFFVVVLGKNKTITLRDIIVMNVFGDLEDLESALNPTQLPNKVLGS